MENNQIITALKKWVMYAHEILQGDSISKEAIKERNENNKWLEKNGIKDIFIIKTSQNDYTISFSYKGNCIEKLISLDKRLSA